MAKKRLFNSVIHEGKIYCPGPDGTVVDPDGNELEVPDNFPWERGAPPESAKKAAPAATAEDATEDSEEPKGSTKAPTKKR
jgi:hypothetical protein